MNRGHTGTVRTGLKTPTTYVAFDFAYAKTVDISHVAAHFKAIPYVARTFYIVERTGAVVSGRRITDQGVPGSKPGRGAVRFGLEQFTFTPCLVLVKPRKKWTNDRL